MHWRTPSATDDKLLADGSLRLAPPSVTLACQSRRRPPCRSHSSLRARARGSSSYPSCPAAGAAALAPTRRGSGECVSWTRTAVRHVFHIVSTGEPALAVQVGHLRRSPRRRSAGAGGLRFPEEQGTGLQQVIHSVSRTTAPKRPGWPLAIPTFSTGPGTDRIDAGSGPWSRSPAPARQGEEPDPTLYPQASMPGS
jgi:hypothetical protein